MNCGSTLPDLTTTNAADSFHGHLKKKILSAYLNTSFAEELNRSIVRYINQPTVNSEFNIAGELSF